MAFLKALVQPPARLRTLPDRWASLLRMLWIIVSLLSVAAVTLGTINALRDTYEVMPSFRAVDLDYDVEDNGEITVQRRTSPDVPGSGEKYRIAAIDGAPVATNIRAAALGKLLSAGKGKTVTLDLANRTGKVSRVEIAREAPWPDAATKRAVDIRVAMRLASGLFACAALLLCSLLLALRRPNDPVALLFAFAFAGMAATIDPPLAMWMAYGWPIAYDVISSVWFYLLLLGLATFPDGIFVPKVYRWLLVAGIALAIFVSLHNVDPNVQVFVGIGALLAMLIGQARRYRRLPDGIERQQIKWAAFGFASGFVLVAVAFTLLLWLPEQLTPNQAILTTAIVLCFSLGMAAIPLGLLVALTRFRLWEADRVITRSAAYAVVTVVVGVVWAASSDLVKLIVEEVLGRESQAGATAVSAVIAAGIFSPTQSLVLGWTRRRFGGPLDQIHDAAKRLKSWGLTESPAEVATRALSIIDQAVHPNAAAIVLDTAMDQELIAAREVDSAEDPRLIEKLVLEDEESSVGTLLLGRRSDGNRYNRQELEAIREIIPSLAEALRVARGRYSRESLLHERLEEMAARLAQLEGGTPKPA